MTPLIEARALALRRGGAPVLEGVDLSVGPGELVALLGPNGAGKSTLLRLLAGELRPSSGDVRVAGLPLDRWEPRALARRRAVMTQHGTLDFPFTAAEVVLLGRAPHLAGADGPDDLAIARDALEAVGASALADRPYPRLSGGERQRVQAARALAQLWDTPGPRLLLLDEPTSSLDLAHQHELLALVRRLVDGGSLAALCVLHDLNLASRYATRVAVLARGHLLRDGPPAHALDPAALGPVFGIDLLSLAHPSLPHPILLAAPAPGAGTDPHREPS